MLKVIGTALLTAFVTSMFWIWFYNFVPQPRPTVARSGPVVTVKPENAPPVEVAQQVQVAPSGLAHSGRRHQGRPAHRHLRRGTRGRATS